MQGASSEVNHCAVVSMDFVDCFLFSLRSELILGEFFLVNFKVLMRVNSIVGGGVDAHKGEKSVV